MQRSQKNSLIFIGLLIVLTCAAMGYTKGIMPVAVPMSTGQGVVTLSGQLSQDKVIYNGDGTINLALTLSAGDMPATTDVQAANVDMVIVLDRSGSMEGQKLNDAKRAVVQLLESLSANDRFALVTYADSVRRDSGLLPVTNGNRNHLSALVNRIAPGGGTNLGAGLQEGISLLSSARGKAMGRVILISDGLANHGITDPAALSQISARAASDEMVISTVGVGNDFNEYLMTALADHGSGKYYYLENPKNFARVFLNEFHQARAAVATGVEVHVPLIAGLSLIDAAGYPIELRNNEAIFRPGDLLAGQSRRLFLTLAMPTNVEQTIHIKGVRVEYQHQGRSQRATLDQSFAIACVNDQKEVVASIDKAIWEEKVLKDDYNKLRDEVAQGIKSGKMEEAMARIDHYQAEKEVVNAAVGSLAVRQNLEQDLDQMRSRVRDTFAGAPSVVIAKQKSEAKKMQYEGYAGRRALNEK